MFCDMFKEVNGRCSCLQMFMFADVHWRADKQVGGWVEGGGQGGHCACEVSRSIVRTIAKKRAKNGHKKVLMVMCSVQCKLWNRVYGDKTEQYIDRGAEVEPNHQNLSFSLILLLKVENMSLLASGGNGAKLYATFENGLAYEVYSLQLDLCFKNWEEKQ